MTLISGSIHKNSHTRYFAVGGYFSFEQDKLKIKAKYKKENLNLKKEKKSNDIWRRDVESAKRGMQSKKVQKMLERGKAA